MAELGPVVRNNVPVTIRQDLPHDVEIVDHIWITMSDGVRLSAKLWLPRTDGPVPVLFEAWHRSLP